MKTQRTSWLSAGCGCVLAMGAVLPILGAVLAAADGTGEPANMAVTGSCFGIVLLIGLAGVVFGLRGKPVDATGAVKSAAAQAMAGGAAPVHVPPGTEVGVVRDAFHQQFGGKDVTWDQATDLMMSRRYDEAKLAFEAIAATRPERRADALVSIGACLHMMGRYADAIASYEEAGAAGADASTVNENIQESRDKLR